MNDWKNGMQRWLQHGIAVGSLLLLSACGGGGSSADTTPPAPPPPAAAVAPAIGTAPAALAVTAGQTASFNVVATGTAPLTYQWQRDGVAISGATSATYAVASTTVADTGAQFRVVVSNAAGNATSAAAGLTVNPAAVGPSITAQPVGTTVTVGRPAGFVALADGTGPLSYQWQRDGVNITGASTNTYSLATTALTDSGASFRVLVSNSVGTVTSTNTLLTVQADAVAAPTIATQPQSASTVDGAAAVLSVAATGTGPFTYQWRKNAVNIAAATNSILVTPILTPADSGAVYSVVVSNGGGSTTSTNATVTVNLLPVEFFVSPVATSVAQGQPAVFVALATGSQPVTYQWRKNGVAIAGATLGAYTIPVTVAADDGALYSVVGTNPANTVITAAVRLTVVGAPVAPTIATAPANVTVSEGQAATFSASAAGTGPLAYQWLRGGVVITNATAVSYTTAATVVADNAAKFSVRVTNAAGSVTSAEAVLTVQAATGGLVGRAWSAGQLLDLTDNEVINHERAISDNGAVVVMYMQSNGTRQQLFVTRGTPNATGAAPTWTAPAPLDVLNGQAVFAGSRYSYYFGVSSAPNGNAVAYWTFDEPCTATSYKTRAGSTCQFVYTSRYLVSTGVWEAPFKSGSYPGNPVPLLINNRGDIAFAVTGGTPATNYPYYTDSPAVAWRAVGDAAFKSQLLVGPISKFDLGMDNSGNMLVGAALTQNATTDAAAYRGTLAAGFGGAQVLDTRGAAVSSVTTLVGVNGQQAVFWLQNNGSRTSTYSATAGSATAPLIVEDMGLTNWDYLHALDNGQIVLVDFNTLRRYRWTAGTWSTAETFPNWQSGYSSSSRCGVARNGDGACVDGNGVWATYDATRNVLVQSRKTASPGTGYVLGFSNGLGPYPPILSTSGVAFASTAVKYDLLPTPAVPAGDGRNVVNLWGFFLK